MKRTTRASLAFETLTILGSGNYIGPAGRKVDIAESLGESVRNTQLIRPGDWQGVISRAMSLPAGAAAKIEVTPETTLTAARRLAVDEHRDDVAVLNFASAKNPGGGFIGGSQAQEESLARSSGLYATLQAAPEYYDANRKCGSMSYTDHAILSPGVPVFRDDDGALLNAPYLTTFITMPAVNVGAMGQRDADHDRVESVMRHRIECVLALAAATGHGSLVLGAWGCGVFRNDPEMIASLFANSLSKGGSWRNRFERIIFAIFGTGSAISNRAPFERHFGRGMSAEA
jgi:uncharacterized protein (TIGR02452 family)